MELGFGGEVADIYHRYRHGYPAAVIDILADAFMLGAEDLVVDLGCGTGQLALPVARWVRAVVGMDPEPDMLRRARQAAHDADVCNVSWMLGADTDVPVLRDLFGEGSITAVTIGQALHWMSPRRAVPVRRTAGAPGWWRRGGDQWNAVVAPRQRLVPRLARVHGTMAGYQADVLVRDG